MQQNRETNLGLKLMLLGVFSFIIGLCLWGFSLTAFYICFAIAVLFVMASISWAIHEVTKEEKENNNLF